MAHIVIVAGGLGSRLAPLTNYIPKFLVNIGKHTGYVEQVRYWLGIDALSEETDPEIRALSDQLNSLTVIVHSAYADLIEAYHDMYFPNVPLTVKTVDVHNGSAHAILSTCEHLVGKSVFFQWCDVMPADSVSVHTMTEDFYGANVIFTNYDHPNRYGLTRANGTGRAMVPVLQEDGRGGIFGLYYVSNFRTDVTYTPGQDFVEIVAQYGRICEKRLTAIVDWGDKPKLDRTRDTADAAREFNSVEFQGNLVLKSALNKQGKTLIGREIEWYRSLNKLESQVARPKTWPADDKHSFIMSKVEGVPIFKLWPTLDNEGRALVLERVFEQLDKLHATDRKIVEHKIMQRDVEMEACDKLMSRYNEIRDVIKSFGNIRTVNGYELSITDPEDVIVKLHQALADEYENGTWPEYSVIHGDLQMSNSMINPDTLEITLIDPRGYFGKSETYGLKDYDIAKLYYSLTGYDLFNYSREFSIEILENGYIGFTIPQPMVAGCEAIMQDRFKHVHELWLAVIWLGLAGYIKNDPVKSVCAHYHGMVLANKLLKG